MKIYLIFYILLLELISPEISVIITVPGIESEDKYKIKKIKDFDGTNYLVR